MSDPNDSQPGAGSAPPPRGSEPLGDTAPHKRPTIPPRPAVPEPPPPSPRPLTPPVQISGQVGGDVAGRDVHKEQTAGRDIVGRDVVTNTTTTTNTTNTAIGFGIAAVQRLMITVGALVFVTAACFFSGGVAAGAGIVALTRTVDSTEAAANRFAAALAALQALPPGQAFQLGFTEQEVSSYFRLRVAPGLPGHITDGKVRLLDNGQVVVGGNAGSLGGLAFAATFSWQTTPRRPLRLTSAAVQVLPAGRSVFGWVAVPTSGLSGVENSINSLFGQVRITGIARSADGQGWVVSGVTE